MLIRTKSATKTPYPATCVSPTASIAINGGLGQVDIQNQTGLTLVVGNINTGNIIVAFTSRLELEKKSAGRTTHIQHTSIRAERPEQFQFSCKSDR